MKDKPMVSRRIFLETAGVATGATVAASTFPHPAVGGVKGANERINFGILGPGGRAQEHIRILGHLKDEPRASTSSASATSGTATTTIKRGLYHSAKRCGLDPQGKDKDRSPRITAGCSTARTSTAS